MPRTICVDLDGTLVRSDLLLESFLQALRHAPATVLSALMCLKDGKAAVKRRLTEKVGSLISVENLPFEATVVEYLKAERSKGSCIELVSGSDQLLVDRVVRHLGLFDAGFGSDGRCNLSGIDKARFLQGRHPEGFVYIGCDRADLAPWMAADEAVCVNTPPDVLRKLRSTCQKVTELAPRSSSLAAVLRAMRFHQWGKNVLIFTSFFLTITERAPEDFLILMAAFVTFGLMASATYLFNDLLDIEADRRHVTKRHRPIASGQLPIMLCSCLALGGVAAGLGLGWVIGTGFLMTLMIYSLLTVAYSLVIKSIPVLDVLTLGVLFYLRLQAGAETIAVPLGHWLAIFSVLFFASLAFAKRYTEMDGQREEAGTILAGRGYMPSDKVFVLSFGAALAVASLLVFLLYAFSGESKILSSIGVAMVCLGVISYWIMRIWFLAARGELDDDPVLFAVKDRISYLLAAVVLAVLVFDQWTR